jgi:hypothetical protein
VERRAVLIMRRAFFLILLLCLSLPSGAGSQTVVLVVRVDSRVRDLDPIAIRKLFLGLPVFVDGMPLHPLRNRADPQLDPIFFQQIVAMSQETYDRQILIGVNRQGRLPPREVRDQHRLLEMLYSDPDAVTFVWLRDVAHDPKIRVMRVIWDD